MDVDVVDLEVVKPWIDFERSAICPISPARSHVIGDPVVGDFRIGVPDQDGDRAPTRGPQEAGAIMQMIPGDHGVFTLNVDADGGVFDLRVPDDVVVSSFLDKHGPRPQNGPGPAAGRLGTIIDTKSVNDDVASLDLDRIAIEHIEVGISKAGCSSGPRSEEHTSELQSR